MTSMSYDIEVSDEEIEEVRAWILESLDSGQSHHPEKTYEEGLDDMIEWLTGGSDQRPDGIAS